MKLKTKYKIGKMICKGVTIGCGIASAAFPPVAPITGPIAAGAAATGWALSSARKKLLAKEDALKLSQKSENNIAALSDLLNQIEDLKLELDDHKNDSDSEGRMIDDISLDRDNLSISSNTSLEHQDNVIKTIGDHYITPETEL